VSTVIADIMTRVQRSRLTIVPPPSRPMEVARAVVRALYTGTEDLFLLRDHRGSFYRWTGTCWPEIDRRDVRAAVYRYLEPAIYEDAEGKQHPFAPTRHKIDDVIDALRAVALLESDLDVPCWMTPQSTSAEARAIISMANGLLHVPTRQLLPQTPAFFTHHALPFAFRTDAPAPTRWLRFLSDLWPEDATSIAALQEVFGYVLGGDTRQQKIFLFVGPKRGGKGTIARVLTGLLGVHNVAAPTLASLATNFGLSPLVGRPLALVSDARLSTKADSKIVVERLLSISGEDTLTIDRKYREPWTGRLPSRFVVLTNELPKLTDSSGALASRFVVFVLTRSFYGRENPALTDELLVEAPAIFNWALDGLDRLIARGYFVTPASGQDAIRQLEDLSSPISAFVRDRCVVHAQCQVGVNELWSEWKTHCAEENRHAGTKTTFGRDLHAALPTIKRTRHRQPDGELGPYLYVGIGRAEHYSAEILGSLGSARQTCPPDPSDPSDPSNSAMYSQVDEEEVLS
jgi:putative DNA primase/helicase